MPPAPPTAADAARLPADVDCGWLDLPRGARAEPLARSWLGARLGIDPDALPLSRDARNRPQLQGALAGMDINWSHSGGRLLVACARGARIGVDVESTARRRPRALELARRYFHPAEHDDLAALPEPARQAAFLRLWCAKEAVLKAHGVGLVFGLHRLRFDAGGRLLECDADLGATASWAIEVFEPAPGFVGARAVQPRAP